MKIFFDTEFTGLHKNTTLISIGLVDEDGRTFYAEFSDYDESQCDDWIKENVINHLYLKESHQVVRRNEVFSNMTENEWEAYGDKEYVKIVLSDWLSKYDTVELVSDVCHYDMVLFIDIFGSAFVIPSNVNPACHDINQDIAKFYNISESEAFDKSREEIIEQYHYLIMGDKHNALYDAKVIKAIYAIIEKWKELKSKAGAKDTVTWLKSLKPQPQKVGIIDGIIWHPTEEQLARLDVVCSMFKADDVLESLLNNLKQLKLVNFYDKESNDKPQPHWKPSEEQISALRLAIENCCLWDIVDENAIKSLTIEEKELLLKDLCARLPYGVKVIHKDHTGRKDIITTLVGYNGHYVETFIDGLCYHLELYDFKPYYRPLSSMTEEEQNELDKVSDGSLTLHDNKIRCLSMLGWEDSFGFILKGIEWLRKHYFDFIYINGKSMIELGLAYEAPKGMYEKESWI